MEHPAAIIITGVSGFLGHVLAVSLSEKHTVIGIYNTRVPTAPSIETHPLDLTRQISDFEAIVRSRPVKLIIHAAAIADADFCENHPDLAWKTNVSVTEEIARITAAKGIPLVFTSTDLLYTAGTGNFTEDAADPKLVYSRSKYEGERCAIAHNPRTLVLRCALMYGPDDGEKGSFLRKMHDAITGGNPLFLFTDQFRTPLWAPDIVPIIERVLAGDGKFGVYNCGGPERISRYDFGMRAAKKYNWDKHLIRPIKMADLAHLSSRPKDCSLNSHKLSHDYHWTPTGVDDGLSLFLRSIR